MKATDSGGLLRQIKKCGIKFGSQGTIYSRILPDISDQKSASYTDETGIGRSMPFKSYQNSDNRTIGWTAHYIVTQPDDINNFLYEIKLIQSAVYPRQGDGTTPFKPPIICELSCGRLLDAYDKGTSSSTNSKKVYAVMKSYNIKYDTSVPWDETTLLPYKFDIDMQFEVLHDQSDLPNSDKIITDATANRLQ